MSQNLSYPENSLHFDISKEIENHGNIHTLVPHHVPGSRPIALITIQQGWNDDSTGLSRIHQTIQEGWFDGATGLRPRKSQA